MSYPDIAGIADQGSRTAVNGKENTIKGLMLGRAQTIADLLLQKLEVPANKISIGAGEYRNSTTIIIK